MHSHHYYMSSALKLARRGIFTAPNPRVGCIITNNGKIVGQGFHKQAGKAHAEIYALKQAGNLAKNATAYVTLEPCCHVGKTAPCTNALIKAGIKKIFIACIDPNPLVAGKGIAALRAANIGIEIGLLSNAAERLNEVFFHFMRTQKPFVIAKWAMSLDGKTITNNDDDKTISSFASRNFAHEIRHQVDAILIGAKTALLDNPLLTARPLNGSNKQPLRIILSSYGDLPDNLHVFDTTLAPTLLATTTRIPQDRLQKLLAKNVEVLQLPSRDGCVDVAALCHALGKRNIQSLLVEGGMQVLHSFFAAELVNKIQVYLAPSIIANMPTKHFLTNVNFLQLDQDFYVTANMEAPLCSQVLLKQ